MSKINVLSSKIYNRIAAGEVVERPCSVVKELVENSIDSGAKNISVKIVDGGKSNIIVTDDGCGIEYSQLYKAVLPHATSKLSSVKDLDNILTLGFRGEALASIGSVSKLQIISKPIGQEFGGCICVNGGEIEKTTEIGAINGTEITVSNLFYNTPAREKFLKSNRGEEGEITSIMSKFILANPEISFKYIVDEKIIYQSFGDGLKSAMVCVYGSKILDDCFYIDTIKHGIAIKGYIGKHYFTKSNRSYQSIFLNGRYVINQTIALAVVNAYSSYLMKRQYPFFVLSINMPSENVDVNVHPNKLDVRFSDNRVVYSAVYSSVSNVLDGSSEALNIVIDEQSTIEKNTNENTNDYVTHNVVNNQKYDLDKLTFSDSVINGETNFNKDYYDVLEQKKRSVTETFFGDKNSNKDIVDIFAENKAYLEKLEKENENKQSISENISFNIKKSLNYVGQTLNTYLIFDDGIDVYFVDQHAAHERLLYDKLKSAYSNNNVQIQPLLLPFVLNVNSLEHEFLTEKLHLLNSMGIEIDDFGGNSFKISSVPVFLSSLNLEMFFSEILSDLNSYKSITIDEILKDKIAQKACKSAIKAGDKLDKSEIDTLLDMLNYNLGLKCPHGRPIAIKITKTEIEKWFKRIV